MAQARDIVSGVPLSLATPPSSSSPNKLGAPELDACALNNVTPQPRESHCQNPAPSVPPLSATQIRDAKTMFFEGLSIFFGSGVHVYGVQDGGKRPDLYLMRGPYGTTIAVETSIMFNPEETVKEIIKTKVEEKRRAYEHANQTISPRGEGTEETGSEAIAWG